MDNSDSAGALKTTTKREANITFDTKKENKMYQCNYTFRLLDNSHLFKMDDSSSWILRFR